MSLLTSWGREILLWLLQYRCLWGLVKLQGFERILLALCALTAAFLVDWQILLKSNKTPNPLCLKTTQPLVVLTAFSVA